MTSCSGCTGYPAAERQFGSAVARHDLGRYRRKGPDASSRVLLRSLSASLHRDDALLDIGGGVGVLSFELLARGLPHATLVDASPAYLDGARSEAERRGVASKLQCVTGDVVHLDGGVEPADVVTMHRVVCCYPDWTALLRKATSLSRRVLAFSYPRDRWYVRLWLRLENSRRRLIGHPFRSFVHPAAAMNDHIEAAGFERVSRRETPVWSVNVYTRRRSG
jgi:hypothetical protein